MRDVLELGPGLVVLGHVHVHLVAVEVGVVGRADGQVEPEGRVGQDPHAVAHHGHPVQRGLPVEEHVVAVLEAPLHHHAGLQDPLDVLVAARRHPLERRLVLAHRAVVLHLPVLHQLHDLRHVVLRHDLGDRHLLRD